ncbi:hypothetical protein [Trueperella pyogenes]|uniref:oxidoreductase n=1 Tax=Trueperella pyogenes TaxID=1661 RepID=UPI003873BDFF
MNRVRRSQACGARYAMSMCGEMRNVNLFDPIDLRGVHIRNRIWLPPMCQYSAPESGQWLGRPNDWHYQHYASRSLGGFGLVTVEATAVVPEGRISNHCLCLDEDADVPSFRHIARVITQHGGVPAIQLNHAGRKGQPRPGSDLLPLRSKMGDGRRSPRALSHSIRCRHLGR